MNFVIVRHPNDNGKYLFKLPHGENIDAGTLVTCDTAKGKDQPGVCITSSFTADPEVICPLWGTYPGKMKRVTKILREFAIKWPQEEKEEQKDEHDDWDD